MGSVLDKVVPNPFTKKDGSLVNPYLNYQGLLDSDKVNDRAKEYIQKATGLTPTEKPSAVTKIENMSYSPTSPSVEVGKRIADTSSYNNNAAKGQCVWYARGRAKEKLGVDPGALGNANQMWYNAKAEAKLSPSVDNIKPNTLLSFGRGTSAGGQNYGHVIYIEDVVGDTVYYTEGGSGYYKNGTDGVVKTATRQGILNGVNSSGARIGSNAIGLIDMTKYMKG